MIVMPTMINVNSLANKYFLGYIFVRQLEMNKFNFRLHEKMFNNCTIFLCSDTQMCILSL